MANRPPGPSCTGPPRDRGRTRAPGAPQHAQAYGRRGGTRGRLGRAHGGLPRKRARGSGRGACVVPAPT
eukprot:15439738-Alexandrium_andersonii.AAC.1